MNIRQLNKQEYGDAIELSLSFAVRFYESLGFTKTAEEQDTDGLRYTPMIRIRE